MLKESWVERNAILKVPAQILQDMIVQRTQKRPVTLDLSKLATESAFTKKLNISSSVTQLVKSSSYLKNVLHMRMRTQGILTPMSRASPTSRGQKQRQEAADFTQMASPDLAELQIYGCDSDKQLVMHHEIALELTSQIMKLMLGKKKKKHAELVLKNNDLLGQIQKIEDVSADAARIG